MEAWTVSQSHQTRPRSKSMGEKNVHMRTYLLVQARQNISHVFWVSFNSSEIVLEYDKNAEPKAKNGKVKCLLMS